MFARGSRGSGVWLPPPEAPQDNMGQPPEPADDTMGCGIADADFDMHAAGGDVGSGVREDADDVWVEEEDWQHKLTYERAWQCPKCESINLRSQMVCATKSCSAMRPLLQELKPGDWFCRKCGNHNFARRWSCNNTHCTSMTVKPGDWECEKCGNHNYASRRWCNKKSCQAWKPYWK